jgi:hypothetical protein
MRIRQLSFDFDGPPEVIVDVPLDVLAADVTAELPVPLSMLDAAPNDSPAAPA